MLFLVLTMVSAFEKFYREWFEGGVLLTSLMCSVKFLLHLLLPCILIDVGTGSS